MSKYLIHSCKKRQWYVDRFLIPSMLTQGIKKQDITVYEDRANNGNLFSTMDSYLELPKDGSTWHLQDDVIIGSWFRKKTEVVYEEEIVCGFCNLYSKENPAGKSNARHMWMSFQCILIPNKVARECAEWFYREAINNREYRLWVQQRKYDDSIFKIFVQDFYPEIGVYHIAPNIVDHIDYLIGGSLTNKARSTKSCRSIYWDEEGLVNELEGNLQCQFGQS